MAGSTFGFSTIASDRGVDVNVAADPEEAFLGIIDNTADGITIDETDQAGTEVLQLVDNGNSIDSVDDIDISVSFDGGPSVKVDRLSADGDGFGVDVVVTDCNGENGNVSGVLTFDIDIGGNVQIATTYETSQITVKCGNTNDKNVDNSENTGGDDVNAGNLTINSGGNSLSTGGGDITVDDETTLQSGDTSVSTEGGDIIINGDLTLGSNSEINTGGGNLEVGGDLIMDANSKINTDGGNISVEDCVDRHSNSNINTGDGSLTEGQSC